MRAALIGSTMIFAVAGGVMVALGNTAFGLALFAFAIFDFVAVLQVTRLIGRRER